MPKNVQSLGIIVVEYNSNKPNQPVIGPGKMGRKDPTMPSKVSRNPRINKKISIVLFDSLTTK